MKLSICQRKHPVFKVSEKWAGFFFHDKENGMCLHAFINNTSEETEVRNLHPGRFKGRPQRHDISKCI